MSGTFLLLNLFLVLYLVPGIDEQTKKFITEISANPTLAVIVAILSAFATPWQPSLIARVKALFSVYPLCRPLPANPTCEEGLELQTFPR